MLQIRETFVDLNQNVRFGDSEWYEPYTGEDLSKLYKNCIREYGRCTGNVYQDMTADGKAGPVKVGWVFLKRMPYENSRGKTYLREVWVTYRYVEDTNDA